MRQCVECRGLVPDEAAACPNCNVGRRLSGLKKALVAVSISVSSCTSCLPYGVPPCPAEEPNCYDSCEQALPDGGSPREDPSTGCRQNDGGIPDGGTP